MTRRRQKKKQYLQWHPAFFAGFQIEMRNEKDALIFENEHQLGTKPKAVDVLVVKKNKDQPIEKNIGRIFRRYNIVEYKGPTDYLSIDDFYKVYGYACFYKADTDGRDSIKVDELTITFVSHNYPRKFLKHLTQERNYTLTKVEDGIYYINGDKIPIQLIWTQELSEHENLYLRSLTNAIQDNELPQKLLEDYEENKDNILYQSVMDIVVRANREKFEEVKDMCEALKELMKDELEERERQGISRGIEQGISQGISQGIVQGMIEACRELGASRENTLKKVREKMGYTRDEAEKYMVQFWK